MWFFKRTFKWNKKIEFGQEFISHSVLSALDNISTCWYVNVTLIIIVYRGWRESYPSCMDLLKVAVVGKVGKGPKYTGKTVAGWSALFYATVAVGLQLFGVLTQTISVPLVCSTCF